MVLPLNDIRQISQKEIRHAQLTESMADLYILFFYFYTIG
jgi:hypothetical protein